METQVPKKLRSRTRAVRQLDALEELGRPEEGRLHHAIAVERRRQVGAVRRSQRDPLGAGGPRAASRRRTRGARPTA